MGNQAWSVYNPTYYDYDACNEQTAIGYWWADGTEQNALVYSYDPAGNVTVCNQGWYTTTYGYDGADQLVSETGGGTYAPPTLGYTYDHNGNRLTQTQNGQQVQSFTYNAHDVLVSGTAGNETPGYDANGNETSNSIYGGTYHETYDDEDRLTSITGPGYTDTFTYNGLGLRVGKTDSSGTYSYACDGASPGAPVLNDGHATYTPGLSENRGGTSTYAAYDLLGNLWFMDNGSAQQTYYQDTSAFGNGQNMGIGGTEAGPFKFGGGNGCQTDSDIGLVLMGHRYYDTRIGRFITQDPAGDGDNWYEYADNSPTNEVDPLGLAPVGDFPPVDGQPPIPGSGWDDGDGNSGAKYLLPSSFTQPGTSSGGLFSGGTVGILADNWLTFGTVQHAGQVAGEYDSGHASRGAALAAGALAVGAIVAVGATRGEDAEGAVEVNGAEKILYVVDNNLPPDLARLLEKEGVSAISVKKAFKDTVEGAADDAKDIVPYVKEKGAILITRDIDDFKDLLPENQIIHIDLGNSVGKASELLQHLKSIIGF